MAEGEDGQVGLAGAVAAVAAAVEEEEVSPGGVAQAAAVDHQEVGNRN